MYLRMLGGDWRSRKPPLLKDFRLETLHFKLLKRGWFENVQRQINFKEILSMRPELDRLL